MDPSKSSSPSTAAPDTAQAAATPPTSPSAATPKGGAPVQAAPGQIRTNDPARTGFDPKSAWWASLFKIMMGQVTPEGQFHYREWREKENEARDCQRCEKDRDWLFAHSPRVRFMRDRVRDLNGELDQSNVLCRRCPRHLGADGNVFRHSGGFNPQQGILICANDIINRKQLEDTLTHEMVHAWDALRWKNVDFVGEKNLKHAACTEIRASMLSGECRWSKQALEGGNWNLTQQFQECVRRRAILSVSGRPRCKDTEMATKAVNQVWDSCFADTRPFDEIYR